MTVWTRFWKFPCPSFPCFCHRVLQGAPPTRRQFCFTFPGASDPLFKASKAPFLTLRVATPSGAPRQGPLDSGDFLFFCACEDCLVFLNVSPLFSNDCGGLLGMNIPCFLGVSLAFCLQNTKVGQGFFPEVRRATRVWRVDDQCAS